VEFFKATTGESHVAVWRKRHGGMSEKMGLNGQRFFYTALRKAEAKHWSKYLRDRVQAKGWNGAQLLRELRTIPRSMSQGLRWFLMKVHLNHLSHQNARPKPESARPRSAHCAG